MEFNPLTVVGTLLGGLILAGVLGWIRKPRLVAFVPKLFSHSKISDNGQIVEIWFMNRGFKNEEVIEATFNPQLRYELIGTNNPSVALEKGKLLIPRIGTGDDSSVLLQVEGGKFTVADIVSCLSKETKATITSKLEEVPITSSQRVGFLTFLLVFGLLFTLVLRGMDWYFESKIQKQTPAAVVKTPSSMQGWKIAEHYRDNSLWKAIEQNNISIRIATPLRSKQRVRLPVTVTNGTSDALSVTLYISASANQDSIDFNDKRLPDKLLMPGQSVDHSLVAAIATSDTDPKVLVELFLETTDGESLKAKQLISIK